MSDETEYSTESTPGNGAADAQSVLRAKYADFCSAQLTEVFLSLSDERIYKLVEEEARQQNIVTGGLGFRRMVTLATQRLRKSVPLPDFDTWRQDYEAEPESYDRYLLGLWKQATESRGPVEPGDGGSDDGEAGSHQDTDGVRSEGD